jgi:hypothetical protein
MGVPAVERVDAETVLGPALRLAVEMRRRSVGCGRWPVGVADSGARFNGGGR